MGLKNNAIPASDQEEITVTLPATALAFLNGLPGSQAGGHGAPDSSSSMVAAAATQSEPFPCFKKSAWGDRATVKITQAHTAPGAA
ncbi:MAG TPA: hypothetical protein VGM08_01815 [Candidatus Saccharimonadales bacterium]|jgi:hypothetical protein